MSDERRPKGVRLPRIPRRLPQLPAAPAPERQIVIQTTPPTPSAPPTVPPTFRAASEWVWRTLVIGIGILALLWIISKLSEVVFPVIIALLLAALLEPLYQRLRVVLPRGLAAGATVLGTLAVLVAWGADKPAAAAGVLVFALFTHLLEVPLGALGWLAWWLMPKQPVLDAATSPRSSSPT